MFGPRLGTVGYRIRNWVLFVSLTAYKIGRLSYKPKGLLTFSFIIFGLSKHLTYAKNQFHVQGAWSQIRFHRVPDPDVVMPGIESQKYYPYLRLYAIGSPFLNPDPIEQR